MFDERYHARNVRHHLWWNADNKKKNIRKCKWYLAEIVTWLDTNRGVWIRSSLDTLKPWPPCCSLYLPIDFVEWISMCFDSNFTATPKSLISNIPALVQIMAWRRPGDKHYLNRCWPNLLTHLFTTLPRWFKIEKVSEIRFNKQRNIDKID